MFATSLCRASRRYIATAVAAIALTAASFAHAQDWPTGTVRIVVPVGVGGTTDALARLFADVLAKSTGKPFIVESKPGANGFLAANELNRNPADGRTLYFGTSSQNSVAPATQPKLGFTIDDFTPIARIADTNIVVLASPKANIKTVKDLVETSKAKPGSINFYSTGVGSYAHLAGEMLGFYTKTKMTHIPYKGFAEGIADMLSGTTHISHDALGQTLPYIKDGRLVAIAVLGPKRSSALPDVPTMSEAMTSMGLTPYSSTVWFGLFGPRGMSPQLAMKINEEFSKAMKTPEVKAKFDSLPVEAGSGTPAEFAAFVKSETEMYRKVANAVNFKVE